MRDIVKLISMAIAFLLVGCVASYKSIEDIPEGKRPAYEVTYDYMDCSVKELQAIFNEPQPVGKADEAGLKKIAYKACDACDKELTVYRQFLAEKTKEQGVADKEAAKLRERTSEKLVELMQDSLKDK